MVNEHTDFFAHVDNFAKTANIPSITIIEPKQGNVKITIAIPTYKRARLLEEAINSALNQDSLYSNYEIIVVDNNPEREDETERLMQLYTENPKIGYYKNTENIGMGGNWNRCYSLAKGKWVVMLHDDDILLPNYLSVVMPLIYGHRNIDMLAVGHSYLKNGEIIPRSTSSRVSFKQIRTIDFAVGNLIGPPVGLLLKKQITIDFGGFNEDFYPTFDYCFYAIFSSCYNVFFLNKVLSLYRIEDNTSMNVNIFRLFVVNDYYLTKSILRNIFEGPFFDRYFFQSKAKSQIAWIKSFWEVEIDGLPQYLSTKCERSLFEKIMFRMSCYILRFFRLLNLDAFLLSKQIMK